MAKGRNAEATLNLNHNFMFPAILLQALLYNTIISFNVVNVTVKVCWLSATQVDLSSFTCVLNLEHGLLKFSIQGGCFQ